jgi:hypothetical protein
LEQKSRDVQARIEEAERHVLAVRGSIQQSLEVARIFEDKIPHQEIIERQNTTKYVLAARLAHQGMSVEAIAARVDLPRGEIEFIAKVNKDRLMFSEDRLPAWAGSGDEPSIDGQAGALSIMAPPAPDGPLVEYAPPLGAAGASLERLGEEFRRAWSAAAEAAGPGEATAPTETAEFAETTEFTVPLGQLPAVGIIDAKNEAEAAAAGDANELSAVALTAPPIAPLVVPSIAPPGSAPGLAPGSTPGSAVVAAQDNRAEGPVVRKFDFPRIGISRAPRPTDNLR